MDILSPNFPQGKLTPEQIEKVRLRFWRKVDTSGECWLWMGAIHVSGYGLFCITPVKHLSLVVRANRVAWELTYGSIPDGLYICHRCNNPRCVNPAHLYPGTPQDNMNDKVVAGHHRNMPKGRDVISAKLTEEQVRAIRETYKIGKITLRDLAKIYGVSYEAIRRVVSRMDWKHIT